MMDVFGNRKPQTQPDIEADIEQHIRNRKLLVQPDVKPVLQADIQADTVQLLAERGNTHGKFEHNAYMAQQLRGLFRVGPPAHGWEKLSYVQREALDMIACKISRILSGQGGHADHWSDIAGYAKLAEIGRQP